MQLWICSELGLSLLHFLTSSLCFPASPSLPILPFYSAVWNPALFSGNVSILVIHFCSYFSDYSRDYNLYTQEINETVKYIETLNIGNLKIKLYIVAHQKATICIF